ncbi:hypothetical protein UA08_04007 [Talaromyces atroroseus]|uniref:FAD-binding PCMH-type domain-containing protein n=1 Tax=Talaromyces atroroseus TaxID=1441469 RepID=A0A1Q5Q8X7_TALAT|nr:hypothetical protein UA08_04007 [Talaromyces atroroseus]OKL60410.1 hypothetical protein UA08_04007 [Talaromyces atroroseus]
MIVLSASTGSSFYSEKTDYDGIVCSCLASVDTCIDELRFVTDFCYHRAWTQAVRISDNFGNASAYPRWSEYDAPSPGVIVNVVTEQDVAVTTQYCLRESIPFLAQNGAHGWASTFNLTQDGILINLHGLNSVTFNDNKIQVTIGGGALISDVITAASANGALGAILGGSYGNLMGLYGFGVDNVDDDSDLFWAFRGAGANFGIVTSATMKSYPVAPSGQLAWYGELIYTADKVEAVVQAIDRLTLTPNMNIFLYFLTSGAPDYTPLFVITPFYYGTEADGREAFASILQLGPSNDTTSEGNYTNWNDGAAGFCTKGGYKPAYTVGLTRMVASAWKDVWDEYVTWVSQNGTGDSIVLMEAYSLFTARSVAANSSSYPWRDVVNFNAVPIPWYYEESLQSAALAWGEKYINFAHGDESLPIIYGDSHDRLRRIKAEADPANVFDQYFDIGGD